MRRAFCFACESLRDEIIRIGCWGDEEEKGEEQNYGGEESDEEKQEGGSEGVESWTGTERYLGTG